VAVYQDRSACLPAAEDDRSPESYSDNLQLNLKLGGNKKSHNTQIIALSCDCFKMIS